MRGLYPVCLHLNSQDFWVAWCPEDEEYPDHFLEMRGMLVWSSERKLLCQFISKFCSAECNSESSFFDFDYLLQQLDTKFIVAPELLLNVWNLLSDLTSTRRNMKPGPFCRELAGAIDQYDLLFFLSQGERKVMSNTVSSTKWNIPLLQEVFEAGRDEVLVQIENGYEVA